MFYPNYRLKLHISQRTYSAGTFTRASVLLRRHHVNRLRTASGLAVQAVVDLVNDILGLGLEVEELGIVLLHSGSLGGGETSLGVHARQLLVDTDVGVVDVNLRRAPM